MTKTLQDITADYKQIYIECKKQDEERAAIISSPEYISLQEQLAAMTAKIPDFKEELAALKSDALEIMKEEGIVKLEGFTVKTRTSKSVDNLGVLKAMGGDMDNLMLVINIPQTKLEAFIQDNPEYKSDLRSCIKANETKIVDLIPII